MKKLTIAITFAFAVAACNYTGEEHVGTNKNNANTLVMDNLKGRVKTKKEIVYFKAVQQGETLVPADTNSYYIVSYHYNQAGFITTKETIEVISGNEQPSLKEVYTYKGNVPEKIYSINKNGDTLNITTIQVTGNRQVALTNDLQGKLSSKIVTILDNDFVRDSSQTFFINDQQEADWFMVRDFSYNKDGILEKETISNLDKNGNVIPEMKDGLTVNYETLSVDKSGNPAKVYMKTLYPNNSGSLNIIYITSYEYYAE